MINIPHYNIPKHPELSPVLSGQQLVVISQQRNSEEDELLQKIIGATGIAPSSYSIIDSAPDVILLSKLSATDRPKYILLFGTDGSSLGIQATLQRYRPTVLLGTTILRVDTLTDIMKTKQLKGLLWQHLKSWFHHE